MAAGTLGRLDLNASPADLAQGDEKLQIQNDVALALQSRGLVPAGLPHSGYRGEMPDSITHLDDEQLGDLLNEVGQWTAFVESELAKADMERKEAEARLGFVKARLRIALGKKDPEGGKYTKDDKEDLVTTHPQYIEAQRRALYTEAVYSLTRALRDQAQRNWETVSRRITQRGQEVDRIRRTGNIGAVPVTTRTFRRG